MQNIEPACLATIDEREWLIRRITEQSGVIDNLRAENAELRKKIEEAPHGRGCDSVLILGPRRECDCLEAEKEAIRGCGHAERFRTNPDGEGHFDCALCEIKILEAELSTALEETRKCARRVIQLVDKNKGN